MALVKCKECGNKVSKKAKTCPQCGAPNKKRNSPFEYFLLIVIIFLGFVAISTFNPIGSSSNNEAPAPKPRPSSSINISSADHGKRWSGDLWPFTVSRGTLKCDRDAVIFVSDGQAYAINGFAGSRGFADVSPIWRDNTAIPGTKINIGAVLDPGLDLCN